MRARWCRCRSAWMRSRLRSRISSTGTHLRVRRRAYRHRPVAQHRPPNRSANEVGTGWPTKCTPCVLHTLSWPFLEFRYPESCIDTTPADEAVDMKVFIIFYHTTTPHYSISNFHVGDVRLSKVRVRVGKWHPVESQRHACLFTCLTTCL